MSKFILVKVRLYFKVLFLMLLGNKKACRTSKSDPGLLDDSAVDDVPDNAEEILEQVEDLLESMHSSLLDSEEGKEISHTFHV